MNVELYCPICRHVNVVKLHESTVAKAMRVVGHQLRLYCTCFVCDNNFSAVAEIAVRIRSYRREKTDDPAEHEG